MTKIIYLSQIAYVLLFVWFYPPICGIEDEQGFVNQAIFWSKGGISAEGAGLSVHLGDLLEINGRHLPIRHPGRSLTVLPFYLVGGFSAIFLSGMLIHLLITWLTMATLRRLGIDVRFALLALFHPTLLIYSRTIMADAAAGLGLLLAVYALVGSARLSRYDLVLAGLGVGLAATMRHHAGAAVVGLALAIYARNGRFRDVLIFLSATFIATMPLLTFNLIAYGSLFDPFSAGRGLFSVKYLAEQIPFYFESLNLFWPFLFFGAFYCISHQQYSPIAAVCLTFLILLGVYYFHDSAPGRLQTDIIGLRLMQVALPAWIVGYSLMLSRLTEIKLNNKILSNRNVINIIPVAFSICGIIMTFVLFDKHQQRLDDLAVRRSVLLKTVSDGGFLLTEGLVNKLVGIYRPDQPDYETHSVTFQGQSSYNSWVIESRLNDGVPVWLVFAPNQPGGGPTSTFKQLIMDLSASKAVTKSNVIEIWRVNPGFRTITGTTHP